MKSFCLYRDCLWVGLDFKIGLWFLSQNAFLGENGFEIVR